MSEQFKKPLTADEIEALLRTARERELVSRSDFVSNEPLGPGDVQHLRNMPMNGPDPVETGWPYDSASTDELLHRAEHHLAEAMSPQSDSTAVESGPFQPYTFQPLASAPPSSITPGVPVSSIGDIELDVSLELGHAELTIEDLLALREGSVVTLDREAGEPIDILANGRLIARGEVIVIDDKFCVRICEVITPR